MIVYEWRSELNKWKWVTWPKPIVASLSEKIISGQASHDWPRPQLMLLDPEGQHDRSFADCLRHYHLDVKIISRMARNALMPHLGSSANILDMQCDFGEYYAVEVTRIENCLDFAHSSIDYLPSGSIGRVNKYVLSNLSQDSLLFRIERLNGAVYVTDRFVTLVRDANLTGFRFIEVCRC